MVFHSNQFEGALHLCKKEKTNKKQMVKGIDFEGE